MKARRKIFLKTFRKPYEGLHYSKQMSIQYKPKLNSMISPIFLDRRIPGEDTRAVGGLNLVLGGRMLRKQMPCLPFNGPFQGKARLVGCSGPACSGRDAPGRPCPCSGLLAPRGSLMPLVRLQHMTVQPSNGLDPLFQESRLRDIQSISHWAAFLVLPWLNEGVGGSQVHLK